MGRRTQKDSIFLIAEEAEVSIATVSRVINRRPGVSEDLRRKINGIIEAHRFTPNYPVPSAMNIAIAVPHEAVAGGMSNYLSRLLCGICLGSSQANVNPCMIFHKEGESLLESMREHQAAGALLVLPGLLASQATDLSASGLPAIAIDGCLDSKGIGHIDNDCESGMSEAFAYLRSLGHARIGYLANQMEMNDHAERVACYGRLMKEAGLEPLVVDFGRPASYAAIKDGLVRLLKLAPDLTAVMIIGDTHAPPLLHACRELGLSVPGDISVVGFDNATESPYFFPPLTTIDHQVEEAGRMAVDSIRNAVEMKEACHLPKVRLVTRLVVRSSCAVPRKGGLPFERTLPEGHYSAREAGGVS